MVTATESQMAHELDRYIADLPGDEYWSEEPDRIERD